MWIDTHCHLDAPEFDADRAVVRASARAAGVGLCIWPAVQRRDWPALAALARAEGDAYALGIHPLRVPEATSDDLLALDAALHAARDDPHLVAVGEIGLDFWVPELQASPLREKQTEWFMAQLRLARRHGLPVILHVRRSVDAVLKGLREVGVSGGIAHAFNGSLVQARQALALGLALGFGGALTHERALQLRQRAQELPASALVLETDAPDMPPAWLYRTAAEREAGAAQGRNAPAQLPAIAQVLATLRGQDLPSLQRATTDNACRVLPRLSALRPPSA